MKEIEKEVLGMLFVSKESAQRIVSDLDEQYFTYDAHRELFNTAKNILDQGKYFDLTLICDHMNWNNATTVSAGLAKGKMTRSMMTSSLAPSMRAASDSSCGICLKNCRSIKMK